MHAKASVSIAVPAAVITGWISNDVVGALLVSVGCVMGIVLSPDLDIDGKTYSETVLPEPFETVWYLYWYVYARLIAHRSWVSHAPVVSTLIRCVYAMWWVPLVWHIDVAWWGYAFWVFVGLCVSDTMHWIMDML